jgi:diguanylate cyclase (GGDEF)-like protein
VATGQARVVRTGGRQALAGPGLVVVYALATWSRPHRSAMLAIALVMIVVSSLIWWRAEMVARRRAGTFVRWFGALASIAGSTAFAALDGGVASPAGAVLPASVIFFALITPLRQFLVIGVLACVCYWAVALFGGPAPPGYPVVYTLAFAGLSYRCLLHAGALISLRRRLAEVSRIDPLTGCLNRGGFDERLAGALADAQHSGRPVTLVLVDLDCFKQTNDAYGHQVGDQLLAWVGHTLTGRLAGRHAVGRSGGDEFAVLLYDAGPAEAAATVDVLRAAIDPVVPASIGYASFPDDAATLSQLRQRADAGTYRDKLSRPRRTASRAAADRVGAEVRLRRGVRVSGRERRRRSVADMGWVAMSNYTIGLLYTVFFTAGHPHRIPLFLCNAAGCVGGLVLVGSAGVLSRSRRILWFLIASALILFPLGAVVAMLDGGPRSALALGTLTPVPLIALGTPIRVAVPVLVGVALVYCGIGVGVGAVGGWYVTMQLVCMGGAAVVCAAQGRAAARQRRLLTIASRTDPLTGALNRRGLEERFAARLDAGSDDRLAALLILDLDGFKKLNDACGHAAGDALLCWVTETLREGVRADDTVARMGGDEFVVLLSPGSAPDYRALAERLRAKLREQTSASIGTAVLGVHGTDFAALYAHADAELYAEKHRRGAGRRYRGDGAETRAIAPEATVNR